ncbi:MAG: penicillin acylase family protein [Chitinophagaceae bacterium]|jgi:acyl-homoserine lactone acylase PvdQ|nr:penicillin acylase family protein [Chitinophagaceae bacterium]
MKKFLWIIFCLPAMAQAQSASSEDIARWNKEAANVTIIRDNWGIPHIYGKRDADCVFGLLYAECEDDFPRVESNYIEVLGRSSEVKGEATLYNDLLIKLVVDSAGAVADSKNAPAWLNQLLDAFADGVNYFLYKHPEVKPALLTKFQAWYPLMYTDGSIGAISTGGVTARELKRLYVSGKAMPDAAFGQEQSSAIANTKAYSDEMQLGSNGFAFAPSKTASGNAILYINPHVTFYFRPEVHVVSEEGLNAYGAVTWGQFFVYQGFNEHCGWMHTSSEADVSDAYIEKMTKKGNGYVYQYDNKEVQVSEKNYELRYKTPEGIKSKQVTVLITGHGPVMANRNGKWLSVKSVNRSMKSLIQSWQRTKSKGLEDFTKSMELLSNMSNNTVYADDKGNIAYWHGDFMPVRNTAYNWSKPVDGSTSATEWKGFHPLKEIIQVHNPASGFIQNCNSTPFTVSGAGSSPKRENYPAYMAPDEENYRGINAVRLWSDAKNLTIDKTIQTGYNTYLTAFEVLLPALFKAYESLPETDADKALLQQAIVTLKAWNLCAGKESVATTLAVEWGQKILPKIQAQRNVSGGMIERAAWFAQNANASDVLPPLKEVIAELTTKFGSANIAWGEINRYQRLTGNIEEVYDDAKESIPVGYVSSLWGCIPSFNSRYAANTKKRYGYNGNSFICAVEFGKKVVAKSLLTGGESGHKNSPHFNDQAEMYANGRFKDVLFYKEDVLKHAEKQYHPGEE